MRTIFLLLALVATAAWAEDDSVELKDGVKLTGAITKEDKDTVYVREANGEEHGIERRDIAKIFHAGKLEEVAGLKPKAAGNAPQPAAVVIHSPQTDTAALIQAVNTMGSPVLAERKAAIEEVKAAGASIIPIMLGMLDPKQKTTEYTRIMILRLLTEMAPLDDQASKTLAFDAVYDPYAEARREACRTINTLRDDLSVMELARYLSSSDLNVRSMAATAARELNDNRLLIGIIHTIQPPEQVANNGPVSTRVRGVPMGPNGMSAPIMTGSQDVSGVVTNTDSPGAALMRQIAGKDFGNLPSSWLSWYGELVGQLTSADYHKHNKDNTRDKSRVNGGSSYPTGP